MLNQIGLEVGSINVGKQVDLRNVEDLFGKLSGMKKIVKRRKKFN